MPDELNEDSRIKRKGKLETPRVLLYHAFTSRVKDSGLLR